MESPIIHCRNNETQNQSNSSLVVNVSEDEDPNAPHCNKHSDLYKRCALFILISPFIYSCLLIVSVATLPLLLFMFSITRIFQLIEDGYHDYKKLTHLQDLIRGWLYMDASTVLAGLWIFFLLAKNVHSLKQVRVLDLPLTDWVVILCVICAIYLISFAIYSLTNQFTRVKSSLETLKIAQAFSDMVDSLLFWWAEHEVVKRIPTLKNYDVLGLPLRKWLRVLALVLIGYNAITLFSHLTVLCLNKICHYNPKIMTKSCWQKLIAKHFQFHKHYIVYYANGLKWSVSFMMTSFLLMFTWVLYFGSNLDLKSAKAKHVWEIGLWSIATLILCSFIWLIKAFLLLAWEARTVYGRLEHKILQTCDQLYFLGIIGCQKESLDIFKLRSHKNNVGEDDLKQAVNDDSANAEACGFSNCNLQFVSNLVKRGSKWASKLVIAVEERKKVKRELLSLPRANHPTLDDIQRAIQYFLLAKPQLSEKNYISEIRNILDPIDYDREEWKKLITRHDEEHRAVKSAIITSFRQKNYWKKLSSAWKLITRLNKRSRVEVTATTNHGKQHKSQSSTISNADKWNDDWDHFVKRSLNFSRDPSASEDNISEWSEKAHKRCIILANTLSSAQEVSVCLNKVISVFLMVVTFIFWLLLTGLATTQIFVIIASPLLAATFIFGDTCKTLFQGFFYVYVVHPLDIGDLCLINKEMMEVKSIGVWSTTFIKVDNFGTTQEEVIFPNSDLSTQTIFNHGTKFDWTDCVEFDLSYDEDQEPQLDIIQFFEERLKDCHLFSSPPCVTVSVKEDNIMKLVIRLEYEPHNINGYTYPGCLRRKHKLQAQFHLLMHKAIKAFKNQPFASSSS